MKKVKDLLQELGFNPQAPRSTQEAFLRNLRQQAETQNFSRKKPQKSEEKQLILPGLEIQTRNKKHVS
ncbi:MAG: hypothetical protein H6625_13705 [Bdellovibrionaceae bacterium]|nr:hypothetical protein [Pseudobdellovibrionaceae bacterium]